MTERRFHYLSTRGQAGRRSFEDVLLAGLAEDGGLFVPESWPSFSADELRAMRGLDYPALAARLLAGFTTGCFTEEQLLRLARQAYTPFDHAATAPLRHLAGDGWLLELFHGPTLAFKDVAMQLLGRLFDDVLAKRRARHHRRRHVGRYRLRRDRGLAGKREASRSSSCTRRAACPKCSAGR